MSIVRQLVQVAAVRAMRGRTLAKQEVHDSKIESLSEAMKTTRLPIIIVSVEESDAKDNGGNDRGFFGRPVDLKMQVQNSIFELTHVPSDVPGEPDELEFTLGETDAAMEGMLNIIDRQWKASLHDPRSLWGDLFRTLVTRVGRVQDVRAVDPELSRRHALRIAQVELECIPEPIPGDHIPKEIEDGLALLESVPDYQEMAGKWRALLGDPENLEDWEKQQAATFASRAEMDALGLGPIDIELTDFNTGIIDMDGVSGVSEVHDDA